jgi:pyruvate-formate lyase-activating enzyme
MSRDAFCILPWTHLEVMPDGDTKICCVAREPIKSGRARMNVSRQTVEEIRNSTYLRSVRQALADGRRIPVCSYCWAQEARGETSQRQLWNGLMPLQVAAVTEGLAAGADPRESRPLEFLQISVGTKCNLACRMCNASYSSRIEEDPVHLKWAPPVRGAGGKGRVLAVLRGAGPTRRNWQEGTAWFEQPSFVEDDMMAAGASLRTLYVTGGEPLFVPAFDRLLDEYIRRGYAQRMTIAINTNLFHNEARIARAMDALLRFKHCHLGPSIDGHGDVYEYVRYPAKWPIVDRNLRTAARLRREHANLTVTLTTVVQIYNVFNLLDLLRYADELRIECKPHVLEGPPHLRPHVLPRELRQAAAGRLEAYARTAAEPGPAAVNRDHAGRIARHLEGIEDDTNLAKLQRTFAAFTRELDASRKQSLERSVPELAAFLAAVQLEPAAPASRGFWPFRRRA